MDDGKCEREKIEGAEKTLRMEKRTSWGEWVDGGMNE